MAKGWGAVTEVGAGWITRSNHDIFNIYDHKPRSPLNIVAEWQTSRKTKDDIIMNKVEFDKFVVKIRGICNELGYHAKDKKSNSRELARYASIKTN